MDPTDRLSRNDIARWTTSVPHRPDDRRTRMMTAAQEAAQAALSTRLRELLPTETTGHFIGGTHTRRFADNLLPSFSAEQVQTLRGQLARGAGDELTPTASGKRRAHAPYSSAALAANAFGGWIG